MTSLLTIQKQLHALGLYTGELDGLSGPKTKAAIRAFQRVNSLRQDGIAGPQTLDALFPVIADRGASNELWPDQAHVSKFYGPVGANQTTLVLPFPMRLAWDKRKIVRSFSIHEKAHDSAKRAFEKIANAYDANKRAEIGLDIWSGCLAVRKIRGGSRYSMHSWGIAIDFDDPRNQLKWGRDKARLAQPDTEEFWRIWESEGWLSLGREKNYDWMHVQAARLK